jgi:hypothetical protein
MIQKIKQYAPLVLAVIALVIALACLFAPAKPAANAVISAKGTTNFSDLAADSATFTDLTATNLAGTGLTLDSIKLSGPYVFSYTAAVVDGTQISHTLGTTPTMVLFTPYTVSLPISCTVFVRGLNAYNITVGMTPSQNLRLYWLAGK